MPSHCFAAATTCARFADRFDTLAAQQIHHHVTALWRKSPQTTFTLWQSLANSDYDSAGRNHNSASYSAVGRKSGRAAQFPRVVSQCVVVEVGGPCGVEMKLSTVLVVAMVLFVQAQDDEGEFESEDELPVAHCIVYTHILAENDLVVAGKDFVVTYTVFSIGDAPCVDVRVRESGPADDFEIVEGSPEQLWEQVEAYVAATIHVHYVLPSLV